MQAGKTKKYVKNLFQPVVEQCDGCDRVIEEDNTRFCTTYVNPKAKWHLGMCNFATHAKPEIKTVKIRINPLKAAKRASRRK